MKLLFSTVMIVLFSYCANGQYASDTLSIKSYPFQSSYYSQGKKLASKELNQILKTNKEAWKLIGRSKRDHSTATAFGFAGGVLLGIAGASLLINKTAHPFVWVSGLGFVGISIPFSFSSNNKIKKAVKLYNSDLHK